MLHSNGHVFYYFGMFFPPAFVDIPTAGMRTGDVGEVINYLLTMYAWFEENLPVPSRTAPAVNKLGRLDTNLEVPTFVMMVAVGRWAAHVRGTAMTSLPVMWRPSASRRFWIPH